MNVKLTFLTLISSLFIVGCATTDNNYSATAGDGPTDILIHNGARYGKPLIAAGSGYYAGKQIGGTDTAGAIGATTLVGLSAMDIAIGDAEKDKVAERNRFIGAASARSEIQDDEWKRQAVYGLPPAGSPATVNNTKYRTQYVPSQTVNGVKMEGGYQTIQIQK
jgi:hypothetical protein